MQKKEVLKKLILEQHNQKRRKNFKPRQLILPTHSGKIIVLTGVRRSGKSTLLKLTAQQLEKQGVRKNRILYLNFDDERLMLSVDELDLILQAYQELYPNLDLHDCYFFFDEIQNLDNWEKFISRIYDNLTENIFISGSNSKVLGSEIATSLRGRTIQYELFPLNFSEYLDFLNIDKNYYLPQNNALIVNAFYQFLKQGGFPETVGKDDELRQLILNDYFQVLLFRDIIERYKITRIFALKFYIQKIIANLGKPFSVNKIFNQLKSQNIRVDKGFLYEVLDYIEAVYLGFPVYKFDYSIVNLQMGDKKIYVIDNGLLNSITWQFSENLGKLFENLLFIWLRQKFKNNVFFYKNSAECDFIIFDRGKPLYCIQASFGISDEETKSREIKGLLEAMDYFGLKQGYIITAEQEEELQVSDKQIFVKPAYKVMIDGKL